MIPQRLALLLVCALLGTPSAWAQAPCGEVFQLETHAHSSTRYTLTPANAESAGSATTAILFIGGGGVLALDEQGCPSKLSRNILMRLRADLHAAGISTVLVDAPSDMQEADGLAGFRSSPEHADDIGLLIAALRARSPGRIWLIGHSRGTLSAANGAARLSGARAPDAVILLSAMLSGEPRGKKAWVSQTVADLALAHIAQPVLLLGHNADNCPRSPASLMDTTLAQTHSRRPLSILLSGGPTPAGRAPALNACEVGEPHDFPGQEAELAAHLISFIRHP